MMDPGTIWHAMVVRLEGVLLGMGGFLPPSIGNPYNWYIKPYYKVDDHPLLCGNNGSLDPGTIWVLNQK